MKTIFYHSHSLQTLLFLIASLAFLLLLIYPKGRQIYQNQLEIELKRIKIDNANAALEELPLTAKEFVQVKTQTEKKFLHLLRPNQIGEILTLASNALDGTELELLSVQPDQQLLSQPFSLGPKIEFHLFPVTLKLSGKYEDMARFTDQLLNQQKWAILDQMLLKKQTGKAIEGELKLLFFLSDEPASSSSSSSSSFGGVGGEKGEGGTSHV